MNHTGSIYAVHKGRKNGLFLHWDGEGGCQEQVQGYPGAVFKKFKHIGHAQDFVKTGMTAEKKPQPPKTPSETVHYTVPSDCPFDPEKEPLIVYVDGSAKRDLQGIPRGGYGIWFGERDLRNVKEHLRLPGHTNNRCEIMAARRAIEIVREHQYADEDTELILMTDSMYVINAMKCSGGDWKGGSTTNRGLLKSLYTLAQTRPVTFMYVPGHKGVKGNEGADRLAKEGADLPTNDDVSS